MRLPNGGRVIVDIRKLRDYSLNPHHSVGKSKARVFASIGTTAADAARLREALLQAASSCEAAATLLDEYSQRYVIDFEFAGAMIRSPWIVLTGEETPRLTTCYVL